MLIANHSKIIVATSKTGVDIAISGESLFETMSSNSVTHATNVVNPDEESKDSKNKKVSFWCAVLCCAVFTSVSYL